MVITIDGPAGAGKSTVSKALAEKLEYIYLDTGSLYRALAYKVLKDNISVDNESAVADLCSRTEVELKNVGGKMKVYLDSENVGEKIRTQEVGSAASKISAYGTVRKYLLNLQRRAGAQGGLVAEGRDMGSVVFPDADYKFYLDAKADERITRRLNEILSKGTTTKYQSVQKEMIARDQQDSKRQHSPLKVPEEAIIIDSTDLSVDQVVDEILKYILTK